MENYKPGYTSSPTGKTNTLQQRFQTLDNKKSSIYRRCEDYAMWTLPYIFPSSGHEDSEMQGPKDSIGPRAVNNLANKLILTLFPAHAPFFRLNASDDVLEELAQEADQGAEELV